MKFWFVFMFTAFIYGCSPAPENKSFQKKATKDFSAYEKLAAFFTTISPDSLYITCTDNATDSNYAFFGKHIDSAHAMLLGADVKAEYPYSRDYSACGKFFIDSNYTAFVVRVPGEYVSSRIEVKIFDRTKDSVVATHSAADFFGDAGEVYSYSSCLFRNKNKHYNLLTYFYSSYDHSVGDPNDTIIEETHVYTLLDISKVPADTLNGDSSVLSASCPGIMQKLK